MTKDGKTLHEEKLNDVINDFRNKGHKIIALRGKCPDAIGIVDGKLVAIDIMGRNKVSSKAKQMSYQARLKKEAYDRLGFDETIIYQFLYEIPIPLLRVDRN